MLARQCARVLSIWFLALDFSLRYAHLPVNNVFSASGIILLYTCLQISSLFRSAESTATVMSTHRVISQGRLVLSRGFATPRATSSTLRTVSTSFPRRQFSLSVRRVQLQQTPATGAEVPLAATPKVSPGINAQSIAITKLPKRVVKADVEQLLRSVGVDAYVAQPKSSRRAIQCIAFEITCSTNEHTARGSNSELIVSHFSATAPASWN